MIYFDNAATSYPKPMPVISSTLNALKKYSFNSGRSGYRQSLKAGEIIYSVREKIGSMLDFEPENIVFTKNCTEALNIAIRGSASRGDHIIISSLEHNSVSRVAQALFNERMIEYDIAEFSFDDEQTLKNFESLIRPNTKAVVCMYASNAFGVVFPIAKIGRLCKKYGIRFIVDGAQGVGIADIKAQRDCIDILCAPGHKCLMGTMGTGFIAVSKGVELEPLMYGGTGSSSMSLEQPDFYPDRLESGTLNNSGIISIGRGIDYINRYGLDAIYSHEMSLAQCIYSSLSRLDDVTLYTPAPKKEQAMPIISFNYKDYSSEKTASLLAKYGICTRAGFHCAPLAHKHFGTTDRGTVRVSLGMFNTFRECEQFVDVVKKL